MKWKLISYSMRNHNKKEFHLHSEYGEKLFDVPDSNIQELFIYANLRDIEFKQSA